MEVATSALSAKYTHLTVTEWRGLNNTPFRALKVFANANAGLHRTHLQGFTCICSIQGQLNTAEE